MRNNASYLVKQVLEIRFKNKSFCFIDNKGKFIDAIVRETGFENIKVVEGRIDIASKDFSKIFFFSYENFGFQIEGAIDIESYSDVTNDFLSMVERLHLYPEETLIKRVGTRTSILYHERGMNITNLKENFKKIYKNYSEFEQSTNTEITETSFYADFKLSNNKKLNTMAGAVTKDEAIKKFLGSHDKYKNFGYENGIFADYDLFKIEETQLNYPTLKTLVKENIDYISSFFNKFVSYINSNGD